MIRRRKLITHPSQAPSDTRHIKVKALQKLPEIIDLAKRDKRSQDYLERAKKRRI